MANWYGVARSNYFAVKNKKKFLKDMAQLEVEVQTQELEPKKVKYAIFSISEEGGWNNWDKEGEQICYVQLISKHLVDKEICVLVECGAEKHRYLTGQSCAFDSSGKTVSVSIDDVYEKAKAEFGKLPSQAEY